MRQVGPDKRPLASAFAQLQETQLPTTPSAAYNAFTTRSGGDGLGLTVCHSIISKHGGFIAAESVLGNASTSSVYLPALAESVTATEKGISPMAETSITKQGGGARILVMDDEEIARNMTRSAMTALGYSVDSAVEGTQALRMYQAAAESGHPYAAVILDLTVPVGMGGEVTIKGLLARHPDATAIVSSGYSESAVITDHTSLGFKGVLRKPYRLGEVAKLLSEVVEKPS